MDDVGNTSGAATDAETSTDAFYSTCETTGNC